MSYIDLTLEPVRVRPLRGFEAADPWSGGRSTQWRISLYRMVAGQAAAAAEWAQIKPTKPVPLDVDPLPGGRALGAGEVIALETQAGRVRMVPRLLHALWISGAVGDRALPAALAALEPDLRRSDFFNGQSSIQAGARWVIVGLLALLSVCVGELFILDDAARLGWRAIAVALLAPLPAIAVGVAVNRRARQRDVRLRERVLNLKPTE